MNLKMTMNLLMGVLSLATSFNYAQGCGPSDWFAAARKGNLVGLKNCLHAAGGGLTAKSILDGATSVLLETTDEAGCTAIVVAAMNARLDTVQFLHEHGADLEARCKSGTTALMHASSKGHLDTIKYLKSAGVDMYARLTPRGWSAVTYAARNGHFETLKFLHSLDLVMDGDWKGGAMHWAAAMDELNLLEMKIKEEGQAGIDTPDVHGLSAAFWAAQNGNLEALKMLRHAGASLRMRSRGDMTMLMAAAYSGRIEICAYLLEQGANIDVKDANGWTAIMWAAASGNLESVKILETAHACVKPKEGEWDPLMVAAASGHIEIVEWFLAKDLPFDQPNHQGKTASSLARDNGFTEIANLVDKMTDINHLHSEHQRNGRLDATARFNALKQEARRIASSDDNNDEIDTHLNNLVAHNADFERIALIRDVQRLHRKTLTLQREKEMDQKKVFQNAKKNIIRGGRPRSNTFRRDGPDL